MKLKILAITAMCLLSTKVISQKTEKVNPKGNVYFGAEIGSNTISSYKTGEWKSYAQGGILAEYYFARHWSLSARLKSFQTGVSFYEPYQGGFFGHDESSGTFKGAVVTIPIDMKWEFRVYRNLGASMKLGIAPTFETRSNYSNYSVSQPDSFSEQYFAFNYGVGLNYFINKETAIYIDCEGYIGGSKGYVPGLLGSRYYNTQNLLMNFGIKYNFPERVDL